MVPTLSVVEWAIHTFTDDGEVEIVGKLGLSVILIIVNVAISMMTIPRIKFLCGAFPKIFPFHNINYLVLSIVIIRVIRKILLAIIGLTWPSVDNYNTEFSASMFGAIVFSVIYMFNAMLMMKAFSPFNLKSHQRSYFEKLDNAMFTNMLNEDSTIE